jgi:hypothetical protein
VTLRQARAAAAEIMAAADRLGQAVVSAAARQHGELEAFVAPPNASYELAEALQALDEWLLNGGYWPGDWTLAHFEPRLGERRSAERRCPHVSLAIGFGGIMRCSSCGAPQEPIV